MQKINHKFKFHRKAAHLPVLRKKKIWSKVKSSLLQTDEPNGVNTLKDEEIIQLRSMLNEMKVYLDLDTFIYSYQG